MRAGDDARHLALASTSIDDASGRAISFGAPSKMLRQRRFRAPGVISALNRSRHDIAGDGQYKGHTIRSEMTSASLRAARPAFSPMMADYMAFFRRMRAPYYAAALYARPPC